MILTVNSPNRAISQQQATIGVLQQILENADTTTNSFFCSDYLEHNRSFAVTNKSSSSEVPE